MAAVRRPSATLALATAVLVFRLASAEPFFTSPGPGPGCGETGVNFVGRSAEAINEAGSLTRCRISNCDSGLKASSTAGFICLDNGLDGIDIDALAPDYIGDGTKHAEGNYFTQFVLRGGDPAADWHQPTNVYFTAPQISARQDSPPVAGEE